MLDENVWLELGEEEKFAELQAYLDELLSIEKGTHPLSNTHQQGRLALIGKELQDNVFKIIEIENAS